MRWDLVSQVEPLRRLAVLYLVAQAAQFLGEKIDLLLLAENRAIEFIDQILGVTDLDFQFGDA